MIAAIPRNDPGAAGTHCFDRPERLMRMTVEFDEDAP